MPEYKIVAANFQDDLWVICIANKYSKISNGFNWCDYLTYDKNFLPRANYDKVFDDLVEKEKIRILTGTYQLKDFTMFHYANCVITQAYGYLTFETLRSNPK